MALGPASPVRTGDGADHRSAADTHRVLVVSADMGAGHHATAAALEEEIRQRWPGSAIRRVDALDLMGIGALFRAIYVGNVEHTPWLYEFFYSSLWRHRWFADASKRFTGSWCGRRLAPVLEEFDPDLVVSTYPLGSSGLAWLRRHRGLSVPTGAWVSDFSPHPFWIYRDLDLNVVLHDAAALTARAAVPGARVVVGPLPVVRAFFPPQDPGTPAHRSAYRILVSCGSYAFGDTVQLIRTLLTTGGHVQVVAVCGRDAAAVQRLEALGRPRDQLTVLGWVDDMPDLLRHADLVLTNAGGATALEALACGVPVLMIQPIAAHGRANADLMVVSGLAELVNDPDRLPGYLRAVSREPTSLAGLRARVRQHRERSDSADALALLAAVAEEPVDTRGVGRTGWPARPSDALFAAVDTDQVRQEVGVVCELEAPPGAAPPSLTGIRDQLGSRCRDVPALHRRLVGGAHRGWVLERPLRIDRHVHELVVDPGARNGRDWSELALEAAGRWWSQSLPLDRPAWQAVLIRPGKDAARADPGSARRPLVALKMHHAVADGISALAVLDHLLGGPPAPPTDPDAERPRGQALARTRGLLTGLASLAAQGRAPRQPLTRPVGADRSIVTWTTPLPDLRDRAATLGVRTSELVLTLIAEALGRLLRPAGWLAPGVPLRAMVPIALRPARLDRYAGNWTGALAADLPVDPMPFDVRLDRVRRELRTRAARGEPQAAAAVIRIAGLLPAPVFTAAARSAYGSRFFGTIVSYLPGPRQTRALGGAPVRALYPVLPLAPGVPVTVAAVTYGASLCVGVTLDPGLGCDPAALRAALAGAEAASRTPATAQAVTPATAQAVR